MFLPQSPFPDYDVDLRCSFGCWLLPVCRRSARNELLITTRGSLWDPHDHPPCTSLNPEPRSGNRDYLSDINRMECLWRHQLGSGFSIENDQGCWAFMSLPVNVIGELVLTQLSPFGSQT